MVSQIFCNFSDLNVCSQLCVCMCVCVGICVCAQKAHLTYFMKKLRQWIGKRYPNMIEKLPANKTSFSLRVLTF